MTLDEYRSKLIERLRVCREAAVARSLLAEAQLMLANCQLTRLTRDRFWETVDDDLRSLAEQANALPDCPTSAAFEGVVAAARARIARYRRLEEGETTSD